LSTDVTAFVTDSVGSISFLHAKAATAFNAS